MVTTQVPIKCQCGNVTGRVKNASVHSGNHLVCMCIDCQTYAHHLNNESMLDENGGTALFQSTPNNFEIHAGKEFIQLVKLSPNGAERFYASCCNTPIANNISAKLAFTSVPTSIIDFDAVQVSKVQTIGDVKYYCMGKDGYGELPKKTYAKFPLMLTLKVALTIVLGKLTKSHRHNPFYDRAGLPIAAPQLLDKTRKQSIVDKINTIKNRFTAA